jgi:hypothetical protein
MRRSAPGIPIGRTHRASPRFPRGAALRARPLQRQWIPGPTGIPGSIPGPTRNAGLPEQIQHQHNVITWRQARHSGLNKDAIYRRIRPGGRWQRLLPGVHLAVTGTPTQDQRDTAALLYAGPGGTLTGPNAPPRPHGRGRDPRLALHATPDPQRARSGARHHPRHAGQQARCGRAGDQDGPRLLTPAPEHCRRFMPGPSPRSGRPGMLAQRRSR